MLPMENIPANGIKNWVLTTRKKQRRYSQCVEGKSIAFGSFESREIGKAAAQRVGCTPSIAGLRISRTIRRGSDNPFF
jgi:hypothetical protein